MHLIKRENYPQPVVFISLVREELPQISKIVEIVLNEHKKFTEEERQLFIEHANICFLPEDYEIKDYESFVRDLTISIVEVVIDEEKEEYYENNTLYI